MRAGRGRAALTAAGLIVLGLAGPSAYADDALPVRRIVAPVRDISFAEADLNRAARVDAGAKRVTITLDATVLFAKDSAKINPRAQRRLAEVAADLRGRGPGRVSITGYTDDLGTAAHGRTLSRQRAAAVAKVLRRQLPGSAYPFRVVGRGEQDPAVPNTSEANRRINRRVVLRYRPT